MLYALLCYGCEDEVAGWSCEQERGTMQRCKAAVEAIQHHAKPGPLFRLMPTTTSVTLRNGKNPTVLDGPFDDTREQLLGLWLFDFETLDDAVLAAQSLEKARNLHRGLLEIRPVAGFDLPQLKPAPSEKSAANKQPEPHL
jgi:hypothetical protein